jgi:hypothetical protein
MGTATNMPRWCHRRARLISDHVLVLRNLRRPFMSKGFGLGRIQRGCLRVIEEYEAAGKRPTMLNIASEVYRVRPDRLSDTQHVATRRALTSLRQKGLVSGQQDISVHAGKAAQTR